MKKLILIFTFLIAFSLNANATENYLHSITLEKNNTGYNIILNSDTLAKVNKKLKNDKELLLEVKNIKSAQTVNAIYKGTTNIDGLVIENTNPDELKIFINADNISDSTVIIEPENGKPTIVGENYPIDKILWIICVMALFSVIFKFAKDISEEDDKILIKKDIKDREIQLYRKYRSQMAMNPSIDSRKTLRMNSMLKKIDRKIDDRLTSINKY